MGRPFRFHETEGVRKHAGTDTSAWWFFQPGQRVMTTDGLPGVVSSVEDGPFPGNEQYLVDLDHDLGGGEYHAGQLRAINESTAVTQKTEVVHADLDANLASNDYPMLADILVERPPLERTASAQAGLDEFLGTIHTAMAADEVEFVADSLLQQAQMEEGQVTPILQDIVNRRGGELRGLQFKFKERDSLVRKLWTRVEQRGINDARDLKSSIDDVLRYTLVFPPETYSVQTRDALYELESAGKGIIEEDNLWTPGPYSALHYTFVTRGGFPVELQIHTDQSHTLKHKTLHALYEEFRDTSTPLHRQQELYDLMTAHWDAIDIPDDVQHFPEERWMLRPASLVEAQDDRDWDSLYDSEESAVEESNLPPPRDFSTMDPEDLERRWEASREGGAGPFVGEALPMVEAGPRNWINNQLPDRMQDRPGNNWSFDWCRARRDQHCYFPKELHSQGTAAMGRPVWVPYHRGPCPRHTWDEQKACPVGEPGPNSGEMVFYPDVTMSWEAGGQRDFNPLPRDYVAPTPFGPVTSARHTTEPEFLMHYTAAWADVQAKARMIRQAGDVRILSAPEKDSNQVDYIVAEVLGDNGLYQTRLMREPGSRRIAMWECGCAWGHYAWGRSGRWKKFEGRMCSHALAVMYEAQSQEGFSGDQPIREHTEVPVWRHEDDVPQARYPAPPRRDDWRLDTAASKVEGNWRPVYDDEMFDYAPLVVISSEMTKEGFKVKYRGEKHEALDVDPEANLTLLDTGEWVSSDEVEHPRYHPDLGLNKDDTGVYNPDGRGASKKTASKVEFAEVTSWGQEFPGQRCVAAYQTYPNGNLAPLGAVVFDSNVLVSVVVLEPARGRGVARALIEKADQLAGRVLPDDGYRTPAGSKLMKALNRPEVDLIQQVTEQEAARPIQGLFWAMMMMTADDPDLKKIAGTTTRTAAEYSGCMVAIRPPDDILGELVATGSVTEEFDNLHITLAYLPDVEDAEKVREAIEVFASKWAPYEANLQGYGTFMPEDSDKVLYASVDGVGIEECRDALLDHLDAWGIEVARNHGWTPHLTLRYLTDDEEVVFAASSREAAFRGHPGSGRVPHQSANTRQAEALHQGLGQADGRGQDGLGVSAREAAARGPSRPSSLREAEMRDPFLFESPGGSGASGDAREAATSGRVLDARDSLRAPEQQGLGGLSGVSARGGSTLEGAEPREGSRVPAVGTWARGPAPGGEEVSQHPGVSSEGSRQAEGAASTAKTTVVVDGDDLPRQTFTVGQIVVAQGDDWTFHDLTGSQREAMSVEAGAQEGMEADLVRSFKDREVPDTGERVTVYRDLSGAPKSGYPPKESWSIKRQKSGEVVAHTQGLRITNVEPDFLEGARRQFQDSATRGVHAFLTGTVDDYVSSASGRPVSYYPDLSRFFMADNRAEFLGASAVTFARGQCLAEGVREGDEVPPSPKFEPALYAQWEQQGRLNGVAATLDDSITESEQVTASESIVTEEVEPALPQTLGDEPEPEPEDDTDDIEEPAQVEAALDESARSWLMNGGGKPGAGPSDNDIAVQAKQFLAAKTFTPEEQAELIAEGGDDHPGARNFDRLDITGTHYEALDTLLMQEDDQDDHEVFWDIGL